MAYKNINVNELGLKQKISYKASRVAFFVPRLLSKLATKLIINPITKIVSGENYEQVNAAATQVTMDMQKDMADEMQGKIDEGHQNLEEWQNDQEYLIGNMAKYKAYNSFIGELENKQVKLRRSPKKLLVARNYIEIMKQYRDVHKEEKKQRKLVQQVVEEYEAKKAEIEKKQREREALLEALNQVNTDLSSLTQNLAGFENENSDILDNVQEQPVAQAQPTNSDEELMDQMSQFAENSEPAKTL